MKRLIIGLVLGPMEFDVPLRHPRGDAYLAVVRKQISTTNINIGTISESVTLSFGYEQGLSEIVRKGEV